MIQEQWDRHIIAGFIMNLTKIFLEYLVEDSCVLLLEDILVHDFMVYHEITEYDYNRIRMSDHSGRLHTMMKVDQHGHTKYFVRRV